MNSDKIKTDKSKLTASKNGSAGKGGNTGMVKTLLGIADLVFIAVYFLLLWKAKGV